MGSYVSTNGADPKTVGLLITATEYAVSAVQRIIQQSSGSPEALHSLLEKYVDLVFGLEVNFVFPNLSSEDRELLVSLMKVRNAMGVQLNGLQQWRTSQQKADHDRLTTELKAQFATLCRRLTDTGLESRLDTVQRQVLNEEFLSILLDKEDNTKLFFRQRSKPTQEPTASAPQLATEQASPLPDAAQSQDTKSTEPSLSRRVLVIDHSTAETAKIRTWLVEAGYEPILAEMDFESCRQALLQKPGLIVLEFSPPSDGEAADTILDGDTVLKILNRLPDLSAVPIVGLSAADEPATRQRAIGSGALACLARPLDRKRFLNAVRVVLDDLDDQAEPTAASAGTAIGNPPQSQL